jgi:DNA-binding transcriptional ArsR family regulator
MEYPDYFYTWWYDIPRLKVLEAKKFQKIFDASASSEKNEMGIRFAIYKILGEGINENEKIRFVLSANEIKEYIEKEIGKKIRKPNLYFHLKVLEENEVIKFVESKGKGKHIASYFGRTARNFLLGDYKEKPVLDLLENEKFEILLLKLNPDINSNNRIDIRSILKSIKTIEDNNRDDIINWVEKNGKLLDELGIDFSSFFNLVNILRIDDARIHKSIIELAKLLKINDRKI